MNELCSAFFQNANTLRAWQERLARTTISSVVWDNLPSSIDPIYLERSLYSTGSVIFFVADGQLVVMKGFGSGKPNNYNIPTMRQVHAPNGFTATLTNENSVICYNDVLRRNGRYLADQYARRLAEIDRTIDVNIQAQKTPILVRAKKNEELSIKNAYAEYIGNAPVIYETADFDPNAITILNTAAPFTSPELRNLQHDIFAEYCVAVGIANAGNYKAERMISTEIASNIAGVLINQRSRLLPRQMACNAINKLFANYLDNPVSVRFETDSVDQIFVSDAEANQMKIGEKNDE